MIEKIIIKIARLYYYYYYVNYCNFLDILKCKTRILNRLFQVFKFNALCHNVLIVGLSELKLTDHLFSDFSDLAQSTRNSWQNDSRSRLTLHGHTSLLQMQQGKKKFEKQTFFIRALIKDSLLIKLRQ